MSLRTLFVLSFALLCACSYQKPFDFPSHKAQELPKQNAELLAAIAEVDITPPPGLPKAGFSTWAQYGDGFRGKLKARVFYLRSRGQQPLVIVQSDLLAGSELLHAALSSRLAQITEINPQNLVITATHTHAAPGNYYGSNFYNDHASNAAGLDLRWFDFLSRRIEQGIVQARDQLRPARIAQGQIAIYGLTRNRSLAPYHNNASVKPNKPSRYEAINPWLTLVRIDLQQEDGQFKPAGGFASFSVHGTAIGSSTAFYHADLWNALAKELAGRSQDYYRLDKTPVFGAFEATHGDIAPNVIPGRIGYPEAQRIGASIGLRAFELMRSLDTKLTGQIEISSALRELDVLANPQIGSISLCEPAVGASLAAGAFEHRSPVIWRLPFIHPGQPRTFFNEGCQGGKHWLGGAWLQPLILPKDEFPHRLLLQNVKIGDSYWVFLPFEITTQSGLLIEKTVRKQLAALGQNPKWLVVSGVANGYTGYLTTADEYALQYYEGGHTLYGPQSAPFLATHSAQIARQMFEHGSFAQLPKVRSFNLRLADYWPKQNSQSHPRQLLGQGQSTEHGEAFDWVRFSDQSLAQMDFDQPLLSLEVKQNGHWQPLIERQQRQDDSTQYLALRWLGGTRYEARSYLRSSVPYRLRIAARAGQPELLMELPAAAKP